MLSRKKVSFTNQSAPQPRVMFVIPGDGQGSSMIFARRQAAALRSQGVDVKEFFLRSRTSLVKIAREMRRFRAELRQVNPNIIHAHYGTVTAMFCALAALELPLVITYRGSDLNPSPGSGRIRFWVAHFLSQLAALRASSVVCVSRQLCQRLWWRHGIATVLASGVDEVAFLPGSRADARHRLGWRFEEPAVMFNRGSDPIVKRLDLAEDAIAIARRHVPGLRWKILNGSTPPELIPAWMNAADCLLVTSDFEGSPTVVQEALASNLPIVSVDVGDIQERLQGVANTRIAARDPVALGAALAHLIAPPRRSDGRRKIAEFSAVEIASRLRGIYAGLLAS